MAPRTPDRTPGPAIEEELRLTDEGVEPPEVGSLVLNGGALKAKDSAGVFDLRSGSGLTEAAHELLDTLAHEIVESSYEEATRVDNRVSTIVYWTSASKTLKVRELAFTRTAGRVTQVDAIQYDASGVESYRMTGVVTRAGGRYSHTTWTRTDA